MRVRVLIGRNKGQIGRITKEVGENVFVDFNRKILVNEGLGSFANYEDSYWVKREKVEYIK